MRSQRTLSPESANPRLGPWPSTPARDDPDGLANALDRILEALRGLRYGSVEVQVHDAQIVRIMRTEKVRLQSTCEFDPRSPRDR